MRAMGTFLQGTKTHLCWVVALLVSWAAGALAVLFTEQFMGHGNYKRSNRTPC